jgi:hypothetical protein
MKTILHLDQMSTSEKLQAMEEIWSDLARNADEIESPTWHQDILMEREKALEEGTDSFISLGEMKSRLREKHG